MSHKKQENGEPKTSWLVTGVAFLSSLVEQMRDAVAFGKAFGKREGIEGIGGKDPIAHPLDSDLEVVKRRTIVRQNVNLSSSELCTRFDFEDVPVPSGWSEKYEVKNWQAAYRNKECRPLVQKMISDDKKRVGEP